jgi:hypothetical protein
MMIFLGCCEKLGCETIANDVTFISISPPPSTAKEAAVVLVSFAAGMGKVGRWRKKGARRETRARLK